MVSNADLSVDIIDARFKVRAQAICFTLTRLAPQSRIVQTLPQCSLTLATATKGATRIWK